ncbi:molybdopterin cofactor-binding domain-containing protein [Rhizobium sp. L1K21]|uniref:molybdopterin cofactor-binding domain-containing protein n=1 Tax=Rhizobium sp. L1K21 TaxID=2954933 RepID=UPI0020923B4B|nr:molybdopterin cofactor-binding domain-containing protein [Rhizobium sp. L1K21]MCO6188275.1 molybdopterin-dependent oxidoreductase [Rhizobium sp. L1K21]
MTSPRDTKKAEWLSKSEGLFVLRDPQAAAPDAELFLVIEPSGITAFCGHVDLGTGIRTALAQIVAEELDVPFDTVTMVLGSTDAVPDQGPTIASETIQISAIPLRQSAATARHYLLNKLAVERGLKPEELAVEDGIIRPTNGENWSVTYGDLVAGEKCLLALDPQARVKPVSEYRLVGQSVPRNDIAAKTSGQWAYVHDVRLPGMLHARLVRPPYAGWDFGDHYGTSLIEVKRQSIADIEGIVDVVIIGDFIGIVAEREEQAIKAADRLEVVWREPQVRPDLNTPEEALRNNPSEERKLGEKGDIERGLEGAAQTFEATYVWPYQMHGSIGPSCAVADYQDGKLTVWSGTQNPHWLRRDIAQLMKMPEHDIAVERLEAAGCYGRNGADDVSGDAALLARVVGRPVRVQLTREQEHQWEPKGAAQVIDVKGGLDAEGGLAAYQFDTCYPSNGAPLLANLLTGRVPAIPITFDMGDRTAIPPYSFPNMKVAVHDMPQLARAAWLRGVSAMPNTFAHECFIDELAAAAGVDPVEYRLRYLTDPRAVDLVREVAEKSGWVEHSLPGSMGSEGDIAYGRGFAYAVYVHGKFPGTAAAWAAWATEVAVNKKTGEIGIMRVVAGQDSGLMINPDGVRHQIHGNVVQSISRTLKESVEFSPTAVTSKDWGTYPILQFPELPTIETLLIPRPDEPPLGVGESASVPSAAAICNAVYDAIGIRFRELPLTPERVLAALNEREPEEETRPTEPKPAKRKSLIAGLSGLGLGALAAGGLALLSPIKPAIPTIARPDSGVFSAQTIEQGRLVAAAGACNVCHVGSDGTAFGGGRIFETPFGNIVASNISPDPENGIGNWSYPAFERAMRKGISRDGHHLYPAHPYTSFAGASDADLQALYAYMMSGQAVAKPVAKTELAFPFNQRWLMSAWNAMFAKSETFTPVAAKSAEWNRGAYLVETLGHCSACHSPRNALQAELDGAQHLAGGYADGWEAPALTTASMSPAGWDADALYAYLRYGHSPHHGPAGGPMAEVVESFTALPDSDIRAMATYLAEGRETAVEARAADALEASMAARDSALVTAPRGARIFEGACASCHGENSDLTSLALNSNLHSASPNNVLQAILNGHEAPAILAAKTGREGASLMAMPAFGKLYDDKQIGELTAYLRARFAPEKPAWENVGEVLQDLRR